MYCSRFFVTIFFILSPPKVLSFSFYSPNRWHLKHASTFFCDVAWCPKTMHSRPFRIGTGGRKIPESSEKYEWVRFKMIVCSTQVLLIDRLDREHGENNVSWLENKDLPQCNKGEQWGFAVFALSQRSPNLKAGVGKILRFLLHRGHSWSLWREFFTCYGPMELSKTTWDVLEDASKNQLKNKLVQKIVTKTISPPRICLKSKIACKCSHLEIQLSWSFSQGTLTAI